MGGELHNHEARTRRIVVSPGVFDGADANNLMPLLDNMQLRKKLGLSLKSPILGLLIWEADLNNQLLFELTSDIFPEESSILKLRITHEGQQLCEENDDVLRISSKSLLEAVLAPISAIVSFGQVDQNAAMAFDALGIPFIELKPDLHQLATESKEKIRKFLNDREALTQTGRTVRYRAAQRCRDVDKLAGEWQNEFTSEVLHSSTKLRRKRLLVAGHDMKFVDPILGNFSKNRWVITKDKWWGHTGHDRWGSFRKLLLADVVLCEWGLGNIVWYSKYKRPMQKLFVRVHRQELEKDFLSRASKDAIDGYIFVSELVRRTAIATFDLPPNRCFFIPNGVLIPRRQQREKRAFSIALVGYVPRLKRLDKALDLVELLRESGLPYTLTLKGKHPSEYAWLKDRPEEAEYYNLQFERIRQLNELGPPAVIVENFEPGLTDWYNQFETVVSVSDVESFHYSLADGAAHGANPRSLNWPGADTLYPLDWISPSLESLTESILQAREYGQQPSTTIEQYGLNKVSLAIENLLGAP